MKSRALFHFWLLAFAMVSAVSLALAQDAENGTTPAPSASASSLPLPSASAPSPIARKTAQTAPPTSPAPAYTSAISPMPNDARVPKALLPPGAFDPDTGPSDIIFPAQQIALRFNHKKHIKMGQQCTSCHTNATASSSAQDSLIPKATKCDECHGTDHSKAIAGTGPVTAGDDATGQCAFCHTGPPESYATATITIPRPNMVFDHKKHAARNIGCQQCHGAVEELELATRDQLPRMRGCFSCHQMSDAAARGTAKGACETCHIRAGATGTTQLLPERMGVAFGGKIRTTFPQGNLKPPFWLKNAEHSPDFMERHKLVAAADSEFCSNCHKEDFCTGCHDGRVRPRNIHPSDFISMHPIEARQASERCTSCHQEQSFCLNCHMRVGVSMSSPTGARDSGRFHPPKSIWSDPPRKPGHHAQEAMRNINACVSCHIERDCVACHGGQGVGGGFNPHNGSFLSSCATQYRRNPRPCLVCHEPGSGDLSKCR